jgi:hypothetical protein
MNILGIVAAVGLGAIVFGAPVKSLGFQKCKREGVVRIQIDQHVFAVPRIILRSVTLPNRQIDQRWPCEDVQLEAQSILINVSRTSAGDEFLQNWLSRQRLPPIVEIVKRGRIKKYTGQHYVLPNNPIVVKDSLGYEVAETGPQVFFDGSALGLSGFNKHKIVFRRSKTKNLHGGHTCTASYPYDEAIDVVYEFDDSHFPQAEWINLDARFRVFLRNLMTRI